jgi:hypothetical protein
MQSSTVYLMYLLALRAPSIRPSHLPYNGTLQVVPCFNIFFQPNAATTRFSQGRHLCSLARYSDELCWGRIHLVMCVDLCLWPRILLISWFSGIFQLILTSTLSLRIGSVFFFLHLNVKSMFSLRVGSEYFFSRSDLTWMLWSRACL